MHHYTEPYPTCDKILSVLATHKRLLRSSIYQQLNVQKRDSQIHSALQHLLQDEYIQEHPLGSSYYDILPKGTQLEANGGFETYFKNLNDSEHQEGMLKWYETANAQKTFEDYASTKKLAIIAIMVAAISAIGTIVQAVIMRK